MCIYLFDINEFTNQFPTPPNSNIRNWNNNRIKDRTCGLLDRLGNLCRFLDFNVFVAFLF